MTDHQFQIFSFKSADGLSIVYFVSINTTRLSNGNNYLKKWINDCSIWWL